MGSTSNLGACTAAASTGALRSSTTDAIPIEANTTPNMIPARRLRFILVFPFFLAGDMLGQRHAASLLLHIFLQIARTDFRPVDVSLRIHGDALSSAGGALRIGIRNKRDHLAILDAADADAPHAAGIVSIGSLTVVRFGVRRVEHVVPVDKQPAGPAELLPFGDKLPILIEDLDTIIGSVSD